MSIPEKEALEENLGRGWVAINYKKIYAIIGGVIAICSTIAGVGYKLGTIASDIRYYQKDNSQKLDEIKVQQEKLWAKYNEVNGKVDKHILDDAKDN